MDPDNLVSTLYYVRSRPDNFVSDSYHILRTISGLKKHLAGQYEGYLVIFLESIDRSQKLKKNSLDGSQSFSGARLVHVDDVSENGQFEEKANMGATRIAHMRGK